MADQGINDLDQASQNHVTSTVSTPRESSAIMQEISVLTGLDLIHVRIHSVVSRARSSRTRASRTGAVMCDGAKTGLQCVTMALACAERDTGDRSSYFRVPGDQRHGNTVVKDAHQVVKLGEDLVDDANHFLGTASTILVAPAKQLVGGTRMGER